MVMPTSLLDTTSSLGPNVLKRIAKEVVGLQQTPLEDIQVLSNYHDLTEIQAWIRGPNNTPYENGYFKIRLVLTEGFPNNPPKGFFSTKIFHPNVSASGEICVNTLKKDWKADVGIAQILLTIKCLLIVPNPESALNEEAGKLLLEDYDDYAKQARLYTKIHAKSGKSEFERLLQQQQQQQQQKASSVNKVAAADTTSLETPIVSAKSVDTELDKQQPSPMTSPHNVLTTSMVSNTVGITVGDTNGAAIPTALDNGVSELKRSASSETNRPTKQARLDDENTGLDGNKNSINGNKKMAPLTHTQTPKDKKKRSLRRL